MDFGQKVRMLRKSLGLSQQELAQKIGVATPVISSYELNKSIPSTPMIRNLADVFQVTTDYLIYENGQDGSGVIRDRPQIPR